MISSKLARDRAVLVVIDIQERLCAAMPPAIAAQVVKHTAILIEAAARLGLPIVGSEQYPRGLGRTVPRLEAALTAAGERVHRVEKLEFSLAPSLAPLGLPADPQWILVGMEAHVCVYQTARDLIDSGASVSVVADAVASRTKANWRIGLDRLRAREAEITSTESVVFELLGRAGTDDFKALSALIK